MSSTEILKDYALDLGVVGDHYSLALWALGGGGVGATLGAEALAELPVVKVARHDRWKSRSRSVSWSRLGSRWGLLPWSHSRSGSLSFAMSMSLSGSWSWSRSWSASLSWARSRSQSRSVLVSVSRSRSRSRSRVGSGV